MNSKDDSNRRIPTLPRDLKEKWYISAADRRGAKEAKQLSSGKTSDEIRDEADAAEAARTELFRNHFERLAILTLYIVWVVITTIGLTWIYHLIAPPGWPQLPRDQVRQIHSIVTGGIIVGIASGHMKKRLQ